MSKFKLAGSVSFGVALLGHAIVAAAFDGKVLERSTGKPVADVWVIGHWETGGAHAGGCVLAITKSNQNGEFLLENRDGLKGKLFPYRSRPAIEYYKRGFQEHRPTSGIETDPGLLDPETRTANERIDELIKLMSFTDCGSEYSQAHKTVLIPLYREIIVEAKEMATSRREKFGAIATQAVLDRLEFGSQEAGRRANAAYDVIAKE